jgi:hypothetical protein
VSADASLLPVPGLASPAGSSGVSWSVRSSRSWRRRLAQGASTNDSSPRDLPAATAPHRVPRYAIDSSPGVRICTSRCRCHSSCRKSRFAASAAQIRGKPSSIIRRNNSCASWISAVGDQLGRETWLIPPIGLTRLIPRITRKAPFSHPTVKFFFTIDSRKRMLAACFRATRTESVYKRLHASDVDRILLSTRCADSTLGLRLYVQAEYQQLALARVAAFLACHT